MSSNTPPTVQTITSLLACLSLGLLSFGCSPKNHVEVHISAPSHQSHGENPSKVTTPKENSAVSSNGEKLIPLTRIGSNIVLETDTVSSRELTLPLHLTGKIEPDYGSEVDASAHISGRVSKILVRPGEQVKAGQTLALIESPQISDLQGEAVESKSKLAIAEAHAQREKELFEEQMLRPKALLGAQTVLHHTKLQLELAEQEFFREEGLYREKIASSKEYYAAKAAQEKAKVDVEQAKVALEREEALYKNRSIMKKDYQLALAEVTREKQHLQTITKRLDFLGADKKMTQEVLATGNINGMVRITAPISGVVSRHSCAVGEVVQPERSMFKLTDLKFVQVAAELPENYLSRVKLGDHVDIKIASYPDRLFSGTISYISVNFHHEMRAVPVRARLANAEGKLRANMSAEIALSGVTRKVLACPRSAVQEIDGKTVVFLKKSGGIEMRGIKTGECDGQYCEILSGLSEGEKVVAGGSAQIKEIAAEHH